MDSNQIRNLLKKYQEGSGPENEILMIDAWLDQHIIRKRREEEGELEERLEGLKISIDQQIADSRFNIRRFLSIAAVFVVFASTVAFLQYITTGSKANKAAAVRSVTKTDSAGWVIISTPKGLTHSFKLPDGSSVALNASSVLRYPSDFGGSARPVYLDEGEAYFSVASDKAKPFTVYTPQFATTALGTAFNVRTYRKEHKVSVALVQGKVRVDNLTKHKGRTVAGYLEPHQQIVLNTASEEVQNKVFNDPSAVTGWSQGQLNFDNASAEEVFTSIENHFDVSIFNKSTVKDWKYTGTFKGESLTEILETICLTEGVSYKMLSKDSIQIN